MRWLRVAALAWLTAACASAFPDDLLRTVERELTLAVLREAPDQHVGARVILGGEILATTPRPGQTEIEMLGRRLRRDSIPEWSDRSDGRFLVRSTQFLDPAVYAPGRQVTVLGTVTGSEERKLGELAYRYPILAAERIVLWPRPLAEPVPYPWPYFYDPFWDWAPAVHPPHPYRRRPRRRLYRPAGPLTMTVEKPAGSR